MNFICVYYNPLARFQTEIKGKKEIALHRLQRHTFHKTASDRQTDKKTNMQRDTQIKSKIYTQTKRQTERQTM